MRAARIALCAVLLGLSGAFGYVYWPRRLAVRPVTQFPVVQFHNGKAVVSLPGRILLGDLEAFDDDLFAYLMFDHYRSLGVLKQTQLMLTSSEEHERPIYRIVIQLPNDLVTGISLLANLKASGLTSTLQYRWASHSELLRAIHETTLFLKAYKEPARTSLEQLHPRELQAYLRRFIRFKSMTDPRIRAQMEPVPSPLSMTAASRLAADIIAVSDFYHIPLDLFIGIGAMENNYMAVPGDLNNTAWKRRAEPGDIVLKRRRGRVLVRNDSAGVWQITRQSLRYAHRLYLEDKRDYSKLAERLRPPKKLDMDNVDPEVLTTYAALLLRDLLDRFHGDLEKAAGAYNGGPANPNTRYAEGVQMVANYARNVIERAATLHNLAVSGTSVTNKVKTDGR